MPGFRGLCAVLILIAVFLSSPALGVDDADQVRVIYLSRFAQRGYSQNRAMTPDPSIRLQSVPMPGHHQLADGADIDVLNRFMRIYFPRNYATLVEGNDLVVMFEAPCGLAGMSKVQFDPRWMQWLVKGVRDDGLSLLMMGGDACWGGGQEGAAFYKSWGDTIVDEILPFTSLEGTNPPAAGQNEPYFPDPQHPLARLPWAESGPVELLNKVEPRTGSNLVAQARGRRDAYPWIAEWEQGSGKVVGETQIFWSKGTVNLMFDRWEWFNDFVIYLMYFSVDKALPEDMELVHRLRDQIGTYVLRISLLVSLLEFVEDFGANTATLYDEFEALHQHQKDAEEFYRQGEYQATAEIFSEIDELWELLEARALRTKENALVWVYVIEWFVVVGASLASGGVLWMVMVRRGFYREVETTRLS